MTVDNSERDHVEDSDSEQEQEQPINVQPLVFFDATLQLFFNNTMLLIYSVLLFQKVCEAAFLPRPMTSKSSEATLIMDIHINLIAIQ